MARFQAGEVTSEASSTLPGRAKPPLQSTLSTGHSVLAKKPAVESLSGGAVKKPPLKPTLKNTDTPEPTKSKPLVSKLSNPRLNSADKPENLQKMPPKPFGPQPPEAKAPAPKPSASKPPLSATQSDPRAAFSKASPSVPNRPSWVKEDTDGAETGSAPSKLPLVQLKPTSSISRLRQQGETPASKPSLPNSAPKPPSTFKEAQSTFTKEAGGAEPLEGGSKAPPPATNATPPPKPAASKKPSLKKPSPQVSSSDGAATTTTGPKRNPLVNIFALGPAPAKPNRPPTVNLEPFRRGEGSSNATTQPLANRRRRQHFLVCRRDTQAQCRQCAFTHVHEHGPPPAHGDSIWTLSGSRRRISTTTSTTSAARHLRCRRPQVTRVRGQRQAADQKVDKKQLEAEKKEQEARKKFKLFGPLETIHQGKARLDFRGSKTDLPLKQGEGLDIIRVQGNPEGKWLGRNQEGSSEFCSDLTLWAEINRADFVRVLPVGYVKIASVEIDFNSLKRCNVQQLQDQELYDDVAPDISCPAAAARRGRRNLRRRRGPQPGSQVGFSTPNTVSG
ncbi:unnamed protein product [Tetraodon nigroviridis]|uniref:(spotted green pufferfish) hypothetical protein n=1 Tax=Tetraodon nigroviridis TaxID=99883 RepID=Q4SJ57_TETNG|nr:unnamed protein product [Tetraodon nigroviridis]